MFVLDVFPEGAAGKDGRLQPGDQIVSVCNESFKDIEYEKAREAILKQASGTVRGTRICAFAKIKIIALP